MINLSNGHIAAMSRLVASCLVLGCLLSGCGPSPHSDKQTGSVEATVTYDGKPVTKGTVTLSNNQTGLGGGGELGEEGTVTIPAVPIGDYVVTVTPPPPDPADPNPPVVKYPELPQKFRSEATSPLKTTVKEGTNELKIELKE